MACLVYFSLGHSQIILPRHMAPWCRKNQHQCLPLPAKAVLICLVVSKLFPRCGAESHALDSTEHTCLKNPLFALDVVTGVKWPGWLIASCFKGKGIARRAFPWSVELISLSCYKIFSCMQRLLIWQLWGKSYRFGQKDRQSRVSSVDFLYWLDVWSPLLLPRGFFVCLSLCKQV